ncbi:hypothetical protein N9K16_04125 [Alphaproteobacteria bacterium]|nr:hypothetical protein [Alphaproteobacteria bacterium]
MIRKQLSILGASFLLLTACQQTGENAGGLTEDEVVTVSEAGKVAAVAEYCEVDKGDFEQALIDHYRQVGKSEPELAEVQSFYTTSFNNSLSELEENGKVEGDVSGGRSTKLGGDDPIVQMLTGKRKSPKKGRFTQARDKSIAELREEKFVAYDEAQKKKELRSISVGEGNEEGKRCPAEKRVAAINEIVRVRAAWGT